MKKIFCAFIALIPLNFVRIILYKTIIRYNISWNSRVGWLTFFYAKKVVCNKVNIGCFNYIDVKNFIAQDNCKIGRFNVFKLFNDIFIGKSSTINSHNRFFGTRKGISPFKLVEKIDIGCNCVITNKHLFDISDSITVGDNVTFAGSGTQVWTHGFDFSHTKIQAPVKLGSNIYVGTRSIIIGGVSIADYVSIGAGTTVSSSIKESGFYVSSVVVRKNKSLDYSNSKNIVEYNGYKFVRKI